MTRLLHGLWQVVVNLGAYNCGPTPTMGFDRTNSKRAWLNQSFICGLDSAPDGILEICPLLPIVNPDSAGTDIRDVEKTAHGGGPLC
jgi:hypothetical protein